MKNSFIERLKLKIRHAQLMYFTLKIDNWSVFFIELGVLKRFFCVFIMKSTVRQNFGVL